MKQKILVSLMVITLIFAACFMLLTIGSFMMYVGDADNGEYYFNWVYPIGFAVTFINYLYIASKVLKNNNHNKYE